MMRLRVCAAWLLAALLLSQVALGGSFAVERLVKLASTDGLPEVRAAAAMGLASLWVTSTISDGELKDTATNGATPELRQAAAEAFAARTVTEKLDLKALKALAADSELDAVRKLASQRLSQKLLAAKLSVDALRSLAESGTTVELREAAVAALTQALLATNASLDTLLTLANDGQTNELRQAASAALASALQADLVPLDAAALEPLTLGKPFTVTRAAVPDAPELRQAASAQLLARFSEKSVSLDTVQAVASDPANSVELRRVAAQALGQRLLRARQPLEALQALAEAGPTTEVQGAAVEALVQALVTAVGAGTLSLQDLVNSLSSEDSDALNAARARAVFTLLRPNLIFLTDQPLLEAVVGGQTATIGGVDIDGSNAFLRASAVDFLAGLFLQFGAVNRFKDPLNELLAMASDTSLALGFRVAAGRALVKFFSSQAQRMLALINDIKRDLNRLVIQGRRGQTEQALAQLDTVRKAIDQNTVLLNTASEAAGDLGTAQRLRSIKDRLAQAPEAIRAKDTAQLRDINTFVAGEFSKIAVILSRAPDTTDEALVAFIVDGATPEVRVAAASVMSTRLQAALAAGTTDLKALLDLTKTGQTPTLRQTSVAALTRALFEGTLSDEALLGLVNLGTTPAVRSAAARAWLSRTDTETQGLIAIANGAGFGARTQAVQAQSVELRGALTQVLQRRWEAEAVSTAFLLDRAENGPTEQEQRAASALLTKRFLNEGKTQDDLLALAGTASSAFVRQAAGRALAQLLIENRLSEAELFALVSRYAFVGNTFSSSPELAQALTLALADRFLNPLVSTSSDTTQPLGISNG